MRKYSVGFLGVNLVESENVFLGAVVKINSVRSVLLLAKKSVAFTDEVNNLLDKIKQSFINNPSSFAFFKTIQTFKGVRFMVYNVNVPISHDNATISMLVDKIQEQYMKIFKELDVVGNPEQDEQPRVINKPAPVAVVQPAPKAEPVVEKEIVEEEDSNEEVSEETDKEESNEEETDNDEEEVEEEVR